MRSDASKEVDVLVRVEAGHVVLRGHVRLEDLHVLVEVVVEDEAVRDGEAVRLHGVALAVVEVAHARVEEVDDAVAPRRPGHRHRGRTQEEEETSKLK